MQSEQVAVTMAYDAISQRTLMVDPNNVRFTSTFRSTD